MTSQDGEGGDKRPLPRDIQEHLGRQLRSTLRAEAERPAFLGDSDIPPQFEPHIRRLQAQERGATLAYDAVKQALGLEEAEPKPKPGKRGGD